MIDSPKMISVGISLFKKLDGSKLKEANIKFLVQEAKQQILKCYTNYNIAHIIINNYKIDGVDYSYLPNEMNCNNLCVEAKFICLKKDIILNLKKILSKYQISLNKILYFDYLNDLDVSDNKNIFVTAEKVLRGFNQNEILLINKSTQNKGFFEKFFDFFS